jgi:hypothetical protein
MTCVEATTSRITKSTIVIPMNVYPDGAFFDPSSLRTLIPLDHMSDPRTKRLTAVLTDSSQKPVDSAPHDVFTVFVNISEMSFGTLCRAVLCT